MCTRLHGSREEVYLVSRDKCSGGRRQWKQWVLRSDPGEEECGGRSRQRKWKHEKA